MVDTFSEGVCCRAVLLPAGAGGRHGELGHLPHLRGGGPAGGQAVPLLPPPPQQQQQVVTPPTANTTHNPGHAAEHLAGVKSQRCDPKRIVAGRRVTFPMI